MILNNTNAERRERSCLVSGVRRLNEKHNSDNHIEMADLKYESYFKYRDDKWRCEINSPQQYSEPNRRKEHYVEHNY